jgi:glutamyl-Q tRNA(Asp) synthetase
VPRPVGTRAGPRALKVSERVGYRGRFAPSPTGPLHFGSLVAALGSWLDARHHDGEWLVRIEDVDRPREVAGAAADQLRTLHAFGLQPDAEPLRQRERGALYAAALQRLEAAGDVFRCSCSRSDLAAIGGVHRHCLQPPQRRAAIRLRVPDVVIAFEDRCAGHVSQSLGTEVGDVVLRRADGLWAYQLAVVVDDAEQGITDVVRGADLLDSTPRQIYLQQRLALPTPRYLHLPLILDADGRKLSKRTAAVAVDADDPLPALRLAWRALGQTPGSVGGTLGVAAFLRSAATAFEPRRVNAAACSIDTLAGQQAPGRAV